MTLAATLKRHIQDDLNACESSPSPKRLKNELYEDMTEKYLAKRKRNAEDSEIYFDHEPKRIKSEFTDQMMECESCSDDNLTPNPFNGQSTHANLITFPNETIMSAWDIMPSIPAPPIWTIPSISQCNGAGQLILWSKLPDLVSELNDKNQINSDNKV